MITQTKVFVCRDEGVRCGGFECALECWRSCAVTMFGRAFGAVLSWEHFTKVRTNSQFANHRNQKSHKDHQISFHYNTSFKNTLALIMLRLRLMSYKMGSNAFYASHHPNTHATYSTPRAARMLTKREKTTQNTQSSLSVYLHKA